MQPEFVRDDAGIELSVAIGNPGHGVVTSSPAGIRCRDACAAVFERGREVTLVAHPDDGWRFAGWGGACAGTRSCLVTLDEPMRVTADFRQQMHTLTTIVEGDGTILANGRDCSGGCDFTAGLTVTLEARAGSGSYHGGGGPAATRRAPGSAR